MTTWQEEKRGTKKSKKGLLRVYESISVDMDTQKINNRKLVVEDQQTKEQEKQGLLETVFLDGKLVKQYTLQEIRDRLWKSK